MQSHAYLGTDGKCHSDSAEPPDKTYLTAYCIKSS